MTRRHVGWIAVAFLVLALVKFGHTLYREHQREEQRQEHRR